MLVFESTQSLKDPASARERRRVWTREFIGTTMTKVGSAEAAAPVGLLGSPKWSRGIYWERNSLICLTTPRIPITSESPIHNLISHEYVTFVYILYDTLSPF